jgi:hypothetical protein
VKRLLRVASTKKTSAVFLERFRDTEKPRARRVSRADDERRTRRFRFRFVFVFVIVSRLSLLRADTRRVDVMNVRGLLVLTAASSTNPPRTRYAPALASTSGSRASTTATTALVSSALVSAGPADALGVVSAQVFVSRSRRGARPGRTSDAEVASGSMGRPNPSSTTPSSSDQRERRAPLRSAPGDEAVAGVCGAEGAHEGCGWRRRR